MPSLRQKRYTWLREHHLVPREARMFSVLPKSTPALKALVRDRDARWEKFTRQAAVKVSSGKWKLGQVSEKWLANLHRWYRKNGWLAKGEAKGKQQKMRKGEVNPWACYRGYERYAPGKSYVSPWEVKQVKEGKTPFDRGQVFVQKAEKGATRGTIQHWIRQLNESIRMFPKNREQYDRQIERLEGML